VSRLAGDLETSYSFDALRGIQAGREFYVAMCPLKIIPKLFIFNEEELPPQFRAQRILRDTRIPSIAHYIVNNPKDYVFSSLTASVDGAMKFTPDPSAGSDGKIGRLHISMESRLLINDGQHRRAAIEEALKSKPELGNESISVVFFSDKGLKRSQQMFADLNKHAVKPTKSLGILYDHRDEFAQFIVKMVNDLDIFHNRTELEKTSISNRSTKFFTLNGISDATKYLLKLNTKTILPEKQKLAADFWNTVSKNIPEWNLLMEKKVAPHELRSEYVHSHTNILNALGLMGHVLVTKYPDDWKQKLKGLQKIDWARDSSLWEGKVVVDGRMLKQKAGIKKAANVILKKCGSSVTITQFEKQLVAA
jgi:DNA sulfur modification protein DndB